MVHGATLSQHNVQLDIELCKERRTAENKTFKIKRK